MDVPWTNKNLTLKWEHFVSKLEPGKKETFTAVVTGPDAKRAVAEMVATLYDESLDQYLPQKWMEIRCLPPGFEPDQPSSRTWSSISSRCKAVAAFQGGTSHLSPLPRDITANCGDTIY